MIIKTYYFRKILIVLFIAITMPGCGILKSVVESVSGNYIGSIERVRENGRNQVFNYDIDECFNKVKLILASMETKILKVDRRKHCILALVPRTGMQEDTESIYPVNSTDVGIFFTEIEPKKIKVEISSLSSAFVEYVSDKVFAELDKK